MSASVPSPQRQSCDCGLLASPADLVLEFDSHGVYRRVDTSDESLLILPSSDLLGRRMHDVLSEDIANCFLDVIRKSLDENRILSLVYNWGELRFMANVVPKGDGRVLWIARNETEARRSEEIVQASERMHRAVFENTGTACIMIEPCMTISKANGEFSALIGLPLNEIEGRSFLDFCHPEELERLSGYHHLRRGSQHGGQAPRSYETRFVDAAGSTRPVLLTVGMVPGTGQSVASILDLSELRDLGSALAKQQAYFSQLFDNSPQGILLLDLDGKVVTANSGFERLFGLTLKEIRGASISPRIVPAPLREEHVAFRQKTASEAVTIETRRLRADGGVVHVVVSGFPVFSRGERIGSFRVYTDISEHVRAREELRYTTYHDALTGLGNRHRFLDSVADCIEECDRCGGNAFAVALMNLDRFRLVNDSLGHLFGDALLREVGRRLSGAAGETAEVARLGADDFAILLRGVSSAEEAMRRSETLRQAISRTLVVQEREVGVSVSIGMAMSTPDRVRPEDYLRDAELALTRAKSDASGCRVFDAHMHEEALRRLLLEAALREAVALGQFVLHYQPIVSLSTGLRTGFEALVRWQRPGGELVPPVEFIPLAEETGLIIPLGYQILDKACREFSTWLAANPESPASVSVNISGRQFRDPELTDRVRDILAATGLPSARMRVEITESVLMDDPDNAARVLHGLKALGLRICVDDFGTGYSSLAYLSRFPIDVLKIDRSFVLSLDMDPEVSAKLIQAIAQLGSALNLEVVAEGIESALNVERLHALGCTHGQGYHFARPRELARFGLARVS